MRTVTNYKLGEEWQPGHHGPSTTMTYRDKSGAHTVLLSAGSGDTIDVLREGDATYVISSNYGLGYMGIEVFVNGEPAGDMFLQSDEQVEDVIGRDAWDLTPITWAKVLRNYID